MRLAGEKAKQAHASNSAILAPPVARIDRRRARWHAAHMERHRRMVNVPFGPTPGPRSRFPAGRLLLAGAALALAGCSYLPTAAVQGVPGAGLFDSPRQFRGHAVTDEQVGQITPGVSSRSDVETLLGSPSASGTFDPSEWYYISAITRQRPGRNLGVVEQNVVVVRFDAGGTVQEVRRLGMEDGRDIQMVSRTTPSPGTERSLMQQLFGNIGRVGVPGSQQQRGPGAASPGSAQ
jgi:outer membrane protein assembly factor BamE (lipoprotein component of BamABCDE complex)